LRFCWRASHPESRGPLYAAKFLIALLLELYGTWLGSWKWASREPWFGLCATNPPVAVGALYCARDALVALAVGGCAGSPSRGDCRAQRPLSRHHCDS